MQNTKTPFTIGWWIDRYRESVTQVFSAYGINGEAYDRYYELSEWIKNRIKNKYDSHEQL